MRVEQRLEHAGTRRRQPQPQRGTGRFDRRERLAATLAVIVRPERHGLVAELDLCIVTL